MEVVDLPPNKVSVGYKSVYKVKYKADDSIKRFKATVVAKGCKKNRMNRLPFGTFSRVT